MNNNDLATHMRECIQKVATGPEYSKDLSEDEAYKATCALLHNEADPVQSAIYLIALRMKRETPAENRGTLQALLDSAVLSTAVLDEVLDIADPYSGCARSVPVSSFVPAVLAALEVPTVLHGVAEVGPKYGVTPHQILQAAGINVALSPAAATRQLEQIGWTYIDQSQFAPQLHALIPLRGRMVKRQVLSTVETLLAPIRGRVRTHHMSGYVHKAYPALYADLARYNGLASALFVRGVEGSIMPSLQQAGRAFYYPSDQVLQQRDVSPSDIGIQATTRAIPLPDHLAAAQAPQAQAVAKHTATLGLAALQGERGLMYDSLLYSAAIVLTHLGRAATMSIAAAQVRRVLDQGLAFARLQAAA